MVEKIMDTAAAADALGVSRRRVVQLVNEGRLPAQRIGRDYAIAAAALALVKDRKPGRPPAKPKPAPKRKRK